MATLAENVSKLVTALTQDKTALSEMKVNVPEGAKHSDIAGLIKTIKTGGPALCTVSITLKDYSGDITSGETVNVKFNGDPKGTYTLNPDSPYQCEYGPGTYRFEFTTRDFVERSWSGVKEVIVPFQPEHFDIEIVPQDDGKLHFQMKLLNYTSNTVYVMDTVDEDANWGWGSEFKETINLTDWPNKTFEIVVDMKHAGTEGVISDASSGHDEYYYGSDYPESMGYYWTGAKFNIPREYTTVTVDWNNRSTSSWGP